MTHLRRSLVMAAAVFTAASAAQAQTWNFGYTGSIVTWTVPASGMYYIEAIGAQGGNGFGSFVGGRGADIGGLFSFTGGDILRIAVGGMGSSYSGSYNGGGGGGSFVVGASDNPLLVAGGGGGIRAYASQNGCDARTDSFGGVGSAWNSTSNCDGKTTDLGMGGIVSASSWGGGGAGFYGNGAVDYVGAAQSWANGLAGGAGYYVDYCNSDGGFGGGGSGTGCGGGGGGGGYSGGDGGWIAGGGGSYNTGTEQKAIAGVGYGNGSVTITAQVVATPEPSTWVLMLTSLGIVGGLAHRKRKSLAA